MIFAALTDSSKKEVIDMITHFAEATGTAEAVKREPLSWIAWLGIAVISLAIIGMLLQFMYRLHVSNHEQTKDFVGMSKEFTQVMRDCGKLDLEKAHACHDSHTHAVKIASEAAHAAANAAHSAAGAVKEIKPLVAEVKNLVTVVMEKSS